MAGSFTIASLKNYNVNTTTASISCTASGWSLPTNSEPTFSTPSSAGTSTTTSQTKQGTSYTNIKYKWEVNSETASGTSENLSYSIGGLSSGSANTITVKLTVTCTATTFDYTQNWFRTRTEIKDSEGKPTGRYTYGSWTKGTLSKKAKDSAIYEIGTVTKTITAYTKPSGTFSWGIEKDGRIDTTLKASSQRQWRARCKAIFNWQRQDDTKSLKSSDAHSGDTITASLYNKMVDDANAIDEGYSIKKVDGGVTPKIMEGGTADVITLRHWTILADAVNNY